MTFNHKHYGFPNEDVAILPVKNITSEALARYLHTQLIGKIKNITELSIDVSETSGQSASYN